MNQTSHAVCVCKRRQGTRPMYFTLIELLIVIAIIAILAGMLLPALNKARGKARIIQCGGQLKSLSVIVLMYADGNDGWGPMAKDANFLYQWRRDIFGKELGIGTTGVGKGLKQVICPDLKGINLPANQEIGYYDDNSINASYSLAFSFRKTTPDSTSYFGLSKNIRDKGLVLSTPNIKWLNRRINVNVNSIRTIGQPSNVPMMGDLASLDKLYGLSSDFVTTGKWLGETNRVQLPHGGSNTILMDGHLQFATQQNYVKTRATYLYHSSGSLAW